MIKIAKFSPVAMVLVALTSINVSSTAYAQEGSMSEVLSHERRDGNRARDEWRHPS